MNDVAILAFALPIVLGALCIVITLWILWAIIRGAVLSALRQYRSEGPLDTDSL